MGVNERESERKIWIFNIVCVSGEQLETSETWSALHKTQNHSSWKCGWARLRRRNSMLLDYLLLSLTENAIIVVFHEWIMSRILYISGCLASEDLQITLSGYQMSPLDLDSGQHHAWSSSDAWENLHPEHDLITVRTFSLSLIRYSASVLSTLFAFLIHLHHFQHDNEKNIFSQDLMSGKKNKQFFWYLVSWPLSSSRIGMVKICFSMRNWNCFSTQHYVLAQWDVVSDIFSDIIRSRKILQDRWWWKMDAHLFGHTLVTERWRKCLQKW